MATISKGYTFGATETVTNTKLHDLVDMGTVSDIVNADVSAGAAIDATKLDLSSAGYLTSGGNFVVTGNYAFSALASLAQIRLQTGVLTSLVSIAEARITNSYATNNFFDNMNLGSLASVSELWAAKINVGSLASIGSPIPYQGIVSSLASGALAQYNGVSNYVGANIADITPSSALTLTSATSVSSSASSGNITIATDKQYLVIVEGVKNSSDSDLKIRFNNADSGSNYQYAAHSVLFNGGTEATSASNNSAQVTVNTQDVDTNGMFYLRFHMNTVERDSKRVTVNGELMCDGATSGYMMSRFSGLYESTLTQADMAILFGGGTWTGNVYLYEYALS